MKNIKSSTPRKTTLGKDKHSRRLLNAITALAFAGLAAPEASAETYTITPNTAATLDWNTAANWTPFEESRYPGTAIDDTAVVRGAFNGNLTVDISATPANPLTGLTLGDTASTGTTTVQSANASSLPLSAATITSSGSSGAVNLIAAPILLTEGLTFGSATNDLKVSGKITPSAAANRSLINASTKTVTLGDIDISTGDTPKIVLTMANTANPNSRLVLAGTIANGGSVPAGLTLGTVVAGKTRNTSFQIDGTNTYTGTTTLSPGGDQPVTFYLNSDQPFGTGPLSVATASNSLATFEALNADRTIPNASAVLQRASAYQGGKSITFAGTVNGGSSQSIANNLTGTARLVFNGRYNTTTSNTDDARTIVINGTGTTVFNGILADSANPTADQFGTINIAGNGTVIVNGTATNQGGFRIASGGTVQLGDGGSTGVLAPENGKKSVVTGGTTGTGFLAVNRSEPLVLSTTLNGGIGLKQIGRGDVTVATPQFHTGSNSVGDGINPAKLIVTAGAVTETTRVGTIAAPAVKGPGYNVFKQVVTDIDTSSLTVGQPAYLESASAAVYIHTIDSASQLTLWGTGLTNATSGLPAGTGTTIKFGAGSALGATAAVTVVKNNATLSGTGTISGPVTAEAGSRLAPGVNTLDADGGPRANFGAAGTLTTGALTLDNNAHLEFDLAPADPAASDRIVTGNGNLSFGALNVTIHALADGTLQTSTPYHLVDTGAGVISGDLSGIATSFTPNLAGRYTATYSVATIDGSNRLAVTFAATAISSPAVPEPTSQDARPEATSKRKWSVK